MSCKIAVILLCFGMNAIFCTTVEYSNDNKPNQIFFEKTDYGLIFTMIKVNDKEVRAMIDFGDQHKLQLSSNLIAELNIETVSAGYQVGDVFGNTWEVQKGSVDKLIVGNWLEENVSFTTQEGEIESVAELIGSEFNAVLGWDYFRRYIIEIDYSSNSLTLFYGKNTIEDEVFSVEFNNDANQLIIPAIVGDQKVSFMIDTGSPVTVVDPLLLKNFQDDIFRFELSEQELSIQAYPQDLSILSDLQIVCILGNDFLSNWKVIIDPNKSKLLFIESDNNE